MEDKLHQFFDDNDFDIFEPHSGHFERFQRKLQQPKRKSGPSFFWMSIAASIILVLGFYLGSYQQQQTYGLADVSPKMAETQSYFVTTINQELKEIEQYRNIETETIIEDSLDQIEELEDKFKAFSEELSKNENKKFIILGMIENYQQRLIILSELLSSLEYQNNPAKFEIEHDEVI